MLTNLLVWGPFLSFFFVLFVLATNLASRSPEIADGVGGLLYNGIKAYLEMVEGDVGVGLTRISRCAEIFVTYPGLCRFSTW